MHHILSIGITKYQISEANNLEFASKDAEDFFNLFTANIDNVGYKKLLTDTEATLTQIRTALGKELQGSVKPDDTLFFFFSGHGDTNIDEDGKPAHFLIPYDATYDITNSGLSVSFLKNALDEIHCKAKVIFIDSCFSGSANSKHFPLPEKKELNHSVKTILHTVSGSGEIVMTASKDSEESIEDKQNKNGLFTYFLLRELQKDNGRDDIPIESIFTPISEAVVERARSVFHHTQTPTMGGLIHGGLLLPKFPNKLAVSASFIAVPKFVSQQLTPQIPIAQVELSDKDQEKQIKDLIEFITNTATFDYKAQRLEFEKMCKKMFTTISKKYDELFGFLGSDLSKLPQSIGILEATSLQFIMLGNVIAAYGSVPQMKIYAHYVTEILKMGEGRAGYVVLTTMPEIVVADIISSIGIGSIMRDDLDPLTTLLNHELSLNYGDLKPLYKCSHIFYCDAVGRDSTKVHDHIRELLKSYTWITEIAPRLDESKIIDAELQLNLLMAVMLVDDSYSLWADFGRFEASRVRPLLEKIAIDKDFRSQVGALFGIPEIEVKDCFINSMKKIQYQWGKFAAGYFWRSVENIEQIFRPQRH